MIKKIVLVSLTIVWMIIIFIFSNQKAIMSTENSQSFVRSTIVNIYRLFDRNASDEKLNDIVETFDVPVRKIAHFTEYFILGLLLFFTFRSFGIKNPYLIILFAFLYACSDEIHQLFVLGRSGSFIDVILDTIGSSCAVVFFDRK